MRNLNLITISKKEASFLRSKGRAHDVHVHSKNHKSNAKRYFLTTSFKSVNILNEYRKSIHQSDLYKK